LEEEGDDAGRGGWGRGTLWGTMDVFLQISLPPEASWKNKEFRMLPKRPKTSHGHPKEVTLSDFSTIFMPFMLTSWVKFLFFVEL
jgi:hypothetical protein